MMHGFISEKAAEACGSTYWKTPDGKEVEIGGVFESREQGEAMYRWPDRRYVGPVTEFSRRGRVGPRPMLGRMTLDGEVVGWNR
jgi:hypothetical protein